MSVNPSVHAARVLLVDDEEHLLNMMNLVLKRNGFTNLVASNDPVQALELYASLEPDLVLLDLNMPRLSGREVLKRIREMASPMGMPPVVVLSGDDSVQTRLEALEDGARDYIVKPFGMEVVARIRNLLEMRLLSKQLYHHNLTLEQAVQERTVELREAYLDTLRRLALAAEYRDDDTGVHVSRMSRCVERLALQLGYSEADAAELGLAAQMHDIGKIGIPDSVLLKPGRLTPEEFEVIKTHPSIGAQILAGGRSDIIRLAEEIALTHHEKWDGSGYPNGLAAESIPLAGRIVAVCDVLDALLSERPYKKAWPVEEALAELERGAGKHFDPRVVTALLEVKDDVLGIRSQYERP